MSEGSQPEEAPITFGIKASSDARYTLILPPSTTILELKEKLSTSEYANLAPDLMRLIYSGKVMKNDDTLGKYQVKEGHTIHLVRGAASNQRQNLANQGAAPASAPTNLAAGTGNNPLAGLTGARYAGFAQLPNQTMFGPDGGMGPPPDPEQVIGMMQNPQFASTLNEALQNPQLIDLLIQQNPMLRNMGPQVRQMMQTPEFRRMMTDPEQLRQMARMQRMFPGMGPGMPGAAAFPAPGATDTTPAQESAAPPAQAPNPFATLLGGAPGANPFAALFPPPAAANAQGGMPAPASGPTGSQASSQFGPFGNPAQMALMMQMVNSMRGAASASSSTGPNTGAPDAGSNAVPNQQQLQQSMILSLLEAMGSSDGLGGMFGGGTGGTNPFAGAAAGVPQDTRPPEEQYAEQLRQLNDMGFYGFERNVEALRRTGGSVPGAVEYLLNS